MTYSLDLDFWKPGKNDLPGAPRAYVYVKRHTEDERGTIIITPDCVNLRELEGEIKRLYRELDDILKKAKKKFSER